MPEAMDPVINADFPGTIARLNQEHFAAVLEQYSLFCETAEATANRRHQMNAFFLSLMSAIIAGLFFTINGDKEKFGPTVGVIICLAGIALSLCWIRLIHVYRDINTAKFEVIGQIERHLPLSPFWKAEWEILNNRNTKGYLSLSTIEAFIPKIAIVVFAVLLLYSVASSFT